MPGEFDFIDWIGSQTKSAPNIVIGPGDDLAAMKWDANDLLIVGADQVLDGVHFDSKVHSPRDIGRKAMNRNLSDCAAMACLPAAAVVTAACPRIFARGRERNLSRTAGSRGHFRLPHHRRRHRIVGRQARAERDHPRP